jgi:CDP-6-deoxy-D-xylo-4-hexulose-3-dehydrase
MASPDPHLMASSSPESKQQTAWEIRKEILALVKDYVAATEREEREFEPGRTPVRYAGRVYDTEEMHNLVNASLDFWLTEGRYAFTLEAALAKFLGVGFARLVNSGSSANLAAFTTLTSPKLGERRVRRGDEIITVAAGFPTTVAPMVQHGAIPVFLDVSPKTANVDTTLLEDALSSRTKAVMLAHTLGNPFDIDTVLEFCRRNGLWLIEDNCDALGSRYTSMLSGEPDERLTGTFGDLATSSFYPPHHMTTGEGGAVYTSDEALDTIVASIRDWGRDCYCKSGKDNTCNLRFAQQFGELPFGYDHKYTYSHFGYNLKMTDLQASIGVAQLKKLPGFGEARRANFAYLRKALDDLGGVFEFVEATPQSDPSWFGMLITVRDDAPFERSDVIAYLESHKVQTRMLFAGNLLRHPCFDELRADGTGYRIVGELSATDRFMERAFWLGVYPGMTEAHLNYMVEQLNNFCSSRGAR